MVSVVVGALPGAVRVVGLLVGEVGLVVGDAPVLEAMFGLLAVELAVVGVTGVAEGRRPYLLAYNAVAPNHRHVRVAHVISLECATIGSGRACSLERDDL